MGISAVGSGRHGRACGRKQSLRVDNVVVFS